MLLGMLSWWLAIFGLRPLETFGLSLELETTKSRASRRYRARVAYDGTYFQGFQVQPSSSSSNREWKDSSSSTAQEGSLRQEPRTVQGVLEEVLSRRCNQLVRIVGASRTDAGVHANGQAIHFDLAEPFPLPASFVDVLGESDKGQEQLIQLETSLNKMLPPDIRLYHLQRAPLPFMKTIADKTLLVDWNAMFEATKKLYSYRLCLAPVMDPLQRYNRWRPDEAKQVDAANLNRILQYYVGTHDFRAFAGSIEKVEREKGQTMDTVRTVFSVQLVDEGEAGSLHRRGLHRIDFFLQGALYKQVRNMVRTALEVCQGRISEDYFRKLIQPAVFENDDGGSDLIGFKRPPLLTRDDNPSKPAPPEGLTLEQVYFENDHDPSF